MAIPRRPVLLLNPGSLYGGRWTGSLPVKPGLVSLSSYLRGHGVETGVLDLQTELGNPEPDEVETFLRRGKELIGQRTFDVLAVSCWSSLEYLAAMEFAAHVRALQPETLIVVGGYHPSAVPDDFCAHGTPFDAVVRGEGEIALLALVSEGRRGGNGHEVRVVDGEPLPLDTLWFDLDAYPYVRERPFRVSVYLSRGCPYHCAFCMERSKGARSWRRYSVETALELVRRALAKRPKIMEFCDPCFGYEADWRRAFVKGLIKMGIDIPLWAQMRADRMAARDLDAMAHLDFYLQFGVETMSPTMARIMRKASDGTRYVSAVAALLEELNRREMLSKVFTILNHPGETPETAEETVSYYERFVATHDRVTVVVNTNIFQYFPGSDIALNREQFAKEYGTLVRHPEWWKERHPQFELATDVRPSHALESARPWIERIRALQPMLLHKLPAAAQLQLLRYNRKL